MTTLADVLDCDHAVQDVDQDGNGQVDAYGLQFTFTSTRAEVHE